MAEGNYNKQRQSTKQNDGYRHAKSVVTVSNPRIAEGHPTQKPLELLRMLIRTYSRPGEVVLDCFMGSGSTGVAALAEGRKFVGIEKAKGWFQKAKDWFMRVVNDNATP